MSGCIDGWIARASAVNAFHRFTRSAGETFGEGRLASDYQAWVVASLGRIRRCVPPGKRRCASWSWRGELSWLADRHGSSGEG